MRRTGRWIFVGISVAALAALFLVVVRPRMLASEAEELMARDPCVAGKGPAGPGFFRAIDLAFRASKFPGVDRDRTDAAQSRCAATFAAACADLEGEAIKRSLRAMTSGMREPADWRLYVSGTEKRTFCRQWSGMIELVREPDGNIPACSYCEP